MTAEKARNIVFADAADMRSMRKEKKSTKPTGASITSQRSGLR